MWKRKGNEVGDFIGGLKPQYARSMKRYRRDIDSPDYNTSLLEQSSHPFIPCFLCPVYLQ